MLSRFWALITTIEISDAFDIVVVAAIFYFILTLLRGTRSNVALRGMIIFLLACFLLYFFARLASLKSLEMILANGWIIIILVFVLVFQNEFKKALTDLGQWRIFRALFTHTGEQISELVKAVRSMSSRHIGAIIAIERRNSLRPYVDTGTPLDALANSSLIRTIFTPYSPLHDGAVILSGERIVSAACILPLTARPDISKELGTRHRAAIGLSEETDALIIVVSEETGTISLAIDGQLERNLTCEDLKKRIETELNIVETPESEVNGETGI
ncbi:MAG TPA: diadenylate cyclase CdaA [Candidatus Sumerlaeota bacterium]|nr:diadenylate cyclase CdaA [Candidatus Sumerlaeota bacterium]